MLDDFIVSTHQKRANTAETEHIVPVENFCRTFPEWREGHPLCVHKDGKYGAGKLLMVILVTALTTGIANYVFFPHARLLGASGVVFSLILLSSITGSQHGGIPLTFLLVAGLYLGQQVYETFFVSGNVSHSTYIIGGIIGAAMGFAMMRIVSAISFNAGSECGLRGPGGSGFAALTIQATHGWRDSLASGKTVSSIFENTLNVFKLRTRVKYNNRYRL